MEFSKYKLKDLTVNGKGAYGIGASAVEYSPDLYKYLRITDIDDDGFINSNHMKSINDKNEERYLLKPNDIVFARTGNSTGKSYFYSSDDGPLVYAGFLIKFSLDPTKLNPRYLRYYTLTNEYKGWVHQFSIGSTRKNINAKIFGDMEIGLPPRYYQNFVVDILDSLENKVKINKQIIANLEELSQTLFKRWFVDFEFPDKDGIPYKSSGGEMIDSELGEIPKKWNILTINDFADDLIITGKTPSTKNKDNYSEKDIPFLTIPDMHTDVFSLNTIKYISEVGIEKVKNKIIPENSLCVSCIATPGLVSITSSETLTNQQINSFTPKKNDLYYLYFYIKNMKKYIEDLGSGGSATLNLNKTQFSKIKIIRPINDLLKKFHKCVDSNFKIILTKQKENLKLQELRDTLLPKLMSGEIEIPDDIEVNSDELSI